MSYVYQGSHPGSRPRRLRAQPFLRDLVAEHGLSTQNLILPVFVVDQDSARQPVESMPGVERLGERELLQTAEEAQRLGIPALALFPYVEQGLKDEQASEALNPQGLIPRRVAALKQRFPQLGVICDVALDPYSSHGQDGVVDERGRILNDPTVQVLVRQALLHAESGVDVVAPSDMMDGRIGAIREELDAQGHQDVVILSYSAKYASAFYGPFRDALGSAQNLGKADKKTYQMDPANSDEALRECALDVQQGADMLMVKPALPYLDILQRLREQMQVPVLAYQVSGEYAMLRGAIDKGWLEEAVVVESLTAMRRAGAAAILTYFALDVARDLQQSRHSP